MARILRKQQGYFLIALTAVLAIVAFSFIAGYSSLLAKKEQKTILEAQKTYMEQSRNALEIAYDANASAIDSDISGGAYRNPDTFLALAGVARKWGAEARISNRLTSGALQYTVIALWVPSDSDTTNPPVFNPDTGEFVSCSGAGASCQDRPYIIVSGLHIQQKKQERAIRQLNELASVHQIYFKSKFMLDPDRNVGINYFRHPEGSCSDAVGAEQMPCIDTCGPVKDTSAAALLGLMPNLLVNPWGLPVEVSNKQDCSVAGSPDLPLTSPYRMSFRSSTPWGTSYSIFAIQPD